MDALAFALKFICLAVVSSHDADFNLNSCRVHLSCGSDKVAVKRPQLSGCPQTSYLLPRSGQTSDYIRVKTPIRELNEFSICAWISPIPGGRISQSFVSYATPDLDHGNAILLIFEVSRLSAYFNEKSQSADLVIRGKTHLCFTASTTTRGAKLYINGSLLQSLSYPSMTPILGGGAFIIGQDQDSVMGGFDGSQAFAGTVENFMMWERELDVEEVKAMFNDKCACADDYVIALTSNMVQIEGAVTALPTGNC